MKVKETPMLFNQHMSTALYNDTKSETRRTTGLDKVNVNPDQAELSKIFVKDDVTKGLFVTRFNHKTVCVVADCPYGQEGDIIWVKESYYAFGHWEQVSNMETDGKKSRTSFNDYTEFVGRNFMYPAGNGLKPISFCQNMRKVTSLNEWHKRNSLFMPKAACRYRLQITSITLQRLSDIDGDDAIREGVLKTAYGYHNYEMHDDWEIQKNVKCFGFDPIDAIWSYCSLWVSINGEASWNKNPWVWVIKFKKI